ncbi:MAG: divergent PAP2 family protein [Candidatus Eisenbacteria bacterium]|uniref:Divergent PAP2 family protein n=1 Tax=Eiseniibacteriota bacterium TaxID=2212470 RepID=A0A956RQM5_UNCEI|nr:divergent PAP2 family protein [Candidatus Eisenbacteria bacterium]
MDELFHNRLLWTTVIASLVAQGLKVVLALFTESPAKAFSRVLETGGMPSAHSAAVSALATGVGLTHGWGSPFFALSAVFGYIVIYDATGIRRHAGMHAALLNRLMHELRHLMDEDVVPREALKTLLGHTYPQVLMGIILGIAIGAVSFR